ncbi:M48 family metallopeptidase [Methanobacterium sp.]|uniref:M48 family metallopeptidase n=1 Tax=Methanobacterium sp. TaxID=2164 RepID=UPI003C76CD75
MQTVKIYDLNVEYDIVHRNVKYWRLELKNEKLRIIAPEGYGDYERIIEKHKNWIYKKFKAIDASKYEAKQRKLNYGISEEEFKEMIHEFVKKFSLELDVTVNKVYFRKMKSRWGSCSSRNNISINRYLRYLPESLIEYVVFHEVAHLVELNHSKRFWNIIQEKFNDYKDIEKELSIYWFAIKDTIIRVQFSESKT